MEGNKSHQIVAPVPHQRMEWLDAMRGFTMLLVVAYHVAQNGFVESERLSLSLSLQVLFRMPLFFFVSGFLAYKSTWIWTPHSFASLTWKKLKVQVLPALVFLCVYLIVRWKIPFAEGFMKCMHSPTKGGYWFTWVLLQMFLIYYLTAAFSQPFGKKVEHGAVAVLWVVSLLASLSLYLPQTLGKWYKTDFMLYSSLVQTFRFMHFFLMGNLVHRFWPQVQRLFYSKWFFPVLALVAFMCCADFLKWHTFRLEWANLPHKLAMYSLLFAVVMFFFHYQKIFTRQTLLGRGLQYVGTRTLDIYLLHFIFLPKWPEVGQWINAHQPNFVLDVTLTLMGGVLVTVFCLLTSHVLRISPLLKEYLFGRK